MSVSSNSPLRWRTAILSGVAVAALSINVAVAQPAPSRGPVALLPPTTTVVQPTQEPEAPSLTPTIAVNTLDRIETDRIGLMDEMSGALPADMWVGSDPAFVRAVLLQLPHQMPSLAMRRLAQNLLLPPARQPEEKSSATMLDAPALDAGVPIEADATDDEAPSTWLLEARLSALAAMGDWPSVVALVEVVPQDRLNESMIRLRVDGLLVDGKAQSACNEVQAALTRQPDTHWQQVQVYCQWANKQTSAAQLGLSLLREQGLEDPTFFWAADVMQGLRPTTPADLKDVTPLELAMLRAAGQPFPDALVMSGEPTTLRVLAAMTPAAAEDAKISADEKKKRARQQTEARIVIAERAVTLGMLDPQVLRDLYAALDLKGETVPLADANVDKVSTRAYLYQTAKSQTSDTARAEVVARVIDLTRADKGKKGPDLVTVGRVYAPLITAFEPAPDLIWFAGHAARGLLAAGDASTAQRWIELATQMARGSSEAANVADGLWAITHIATPGTNRVVTAQNFRAWQASLPAAQAAALREGLLNILTALGDQVPPEEWLSVVGAPNGAGAVAPPSYAWNGLTLAARDDRVGDVAALSLITLGDVGPHGASPVTLGKVIESLKAVGRDADARALAVEAALVQGL